MLTQRKKMKSWWVDDTFPNGNVALGSGVCVAILSVGTQDRQMYRKTDQDDTIHLTVITAQARRVKWTRVVNEPYLILVCVSSLCLQASVRPGSDWSHPRGHLRGRPVEGVLVSLKETSGAQGGRKWKEKDGRKEQRMKGKIRESRSVDYERKEQRREMQSEW